MSKASPKVNPLSAFMSFRQRHPCAASLLVQSGDLDVDFPLPLRRSSRLRQGDSENAVRKACSIRFSPLMVMRPCESLTQMLFAGTPHLGLDHEVAFPLDNIHGGRAPRDRFDRPQRRNVKDCASKWHSPAAAVKVVEHTLDLTA